MTQYPSTLAKYYKGGPIGIFPGQSMFETDSTRQGLFEARSSFIRMLNIIFSRSSVAIERALAVETLTAESPVTEYLTWRRPEGTNQIEPVPPSTMYDYVVYSLQERDQLLADNSVMNRIMSGERISVLVNGMGNDDTPQWTVYRAGIPANGPTPDYIVDHPNETFSLAKNYDEHVETFHDRDLLTQGNSAIDVGTRVLVDGVSSTSGFWTIWEYVGQSADPNVDAAGFKLIRYQTYRTDDFWSFTDWYADGYSVTDPPVVTYATAADRDRNENPIPTSTFVKLLDDGTGVWVWTAYSEGAWNVVARQNGTIEFSSKFYDDYTRPTIGLDPILSSDLAKIPDRDGSWELQVMFNQLRDSPLLENIEVNEVFFSMLHFVHAQQDQVTWAFKTSFLNVAGYNEALTQTPVQPIDNTQNLLNYLDEVKPYRVKTRDFTRILTPETDYANTAVKDYDYPVYYDSTTGTFRVLDPNKPVDNAIITTQEPWKSWYQNYNRTGHDPENYEESTWNPVRHMTIGLMFDRVDHMPILADQSFVYVKPEPQTFTVLDLDQTIYDMTEQIVEVYVNGRRLSDLDFEIDSDSVTIDETLDDQAVVRVVVRLGLSAGLAADRAQRFYNPTDPTLQEKNLRTLMGLNFKANILDGGDLANNAIRDYDVDGNADTSNSGVESINPNGKYFGLADPKVDKDRPEELIVTGSGESLQMIVQSRWIPGGPQQAYRVFNTTNLTGPQDFFWGTNRVIVQYRAGVAVFFDGRRVFEGTDYTIDFVNRTINADVTSVNEVIVKTFGISSFVGIERIEEYTYTSGPATFPLDFDYTNPAYLKSVTVDGDPAAFTLSSNSVTLTTPPMTTPARVLFIATPTGVPIGSKISVENFTYTGSPSFVLSNGAASSAEAIVEVNGLRLTPTTQYTITANTNLNISAPLTNGDEVSVTAFSNATPLAMLTTVTNGTVDGNYNIDSPKGISFVWMTIDGVYVDPGIPQPADPSNTVVITAFRGSVLNQDGWAVNMARPSGELMLPKETGDYDAKPFDKALFDIGKVGGSAIGSKRAISNAGAYANGFVVFSREDTTNAVTLPAGTKVKAVAANQTYTVVGNSISVGAGVESVVAPIQADVMGSNGNVGANAITEIVDFIPFNNVYNPDPISNGVNAPEERGIFVLRSDSYEYLNWNPDGHAWLVGNLTTTANSITIMPFKVDPVNPMPVMPPMVEKLGVDNTVTHAADIKKALDDPNFPKKDIITKPGVIWINGERIEFFDYEVNVDNSVTLTELRRGTYNTRISEETRTVVSYIADGNTTAYAMPDVTSTDGLSVSVYEPLQYANGAPIITDEYTGYSVLVPKVETQRAVANSVAPPVRDYMANVFVSGVVVNFTTPPAANTVVYLAVSGQIQHANGSIVHDGRGLRDENPDRPFSGETRYL
jgi:hypothetical protein